MMIHYPDIAKTAQAQIDEVVGTNRLPTFEDRSSLPFVECILKETFRYGILLFAVIPS